MSKHKSALAPARAAVPHNREMRQMIKPFLKTGWRCEMTRGNHLRVVKAGKVVILPSSPSCSRSVKNSRAQLNRAERALALKRVAAAAQDDQRK